MSEGGCARTLTAQLFPDFSSVDSARWMALCLSDAQGTYHPFLDWKFLNALEASQCACPQTGWQACPLVLIDKQGQYCAAAPLYIKSHSMGEYVFDHGWADACLRAGISYYPKLQCAVPFTPVTGPRLLALNATARSELIQHMQDLTQQMGLSGLHITFTSEARQRELEAAGFESRIDQQFHFFNRNYGDFDTFLDSLSSKKRRNIISERSKAQKGIQYRRYQGNDICSSHWDDMFSFYADTCDKKWGRAYLSREFFDIIHHTMRDHVVLMFAIDDGIPIAGSLSFMGSNSLYGRYWGSRVNRPFLHFELCYYQSIEFAIETGLAVVEAGAQGPHKLARGYEPVLTYSSHYFPQANLQTAVKAFLHEERQLVRINHSHFQSHTPFKHTE